MSKFYKLLLLNSLVVCAGFTYADSKITTYYTKYSLPSNYGGDNDYTATIFNNSITKIKNNVYIFSYRVMNESVYQENQSTSVRYGTSIIDLKNNKIGHCSQGWYLSGDKNGNKVSMPWVFDGGKCSPDDFIGAKKSHDGSPLDPDDKYFSELLKKIVNNKCNGDIEIFKSVNCSN